MAEIQNQNQSPEPSMEELIRMLRHDIDKPRATVAMFFEILGDISNQPSQIQRWRELIMKSFDKTNEDLDKLGEHVQGRM